MDIRIATILPFVVLVNTVLSEETPCSRPYMCLVDPCMGIMCEDRPLTCRADYCRGCKALWFDGNGHEHECHKVGRLGH